MYRVIPPKVAFLVISVVAVLIAGFTLYNRLDYLTLGKPGAVLDGSPVPKLDVPAGATDVYIYNGAAADGTAGQSRNIMPGFELDASPQCGDWSVWFNTAAEAEAVFSHFEQQLRAAGFRQTFSQPRGPGHNRKAMQCYTSRNGLYDIEVVRWHVPKVPSAEDDIPRAWAVVALKAVEGEEPSGMSNLRY